MCICAAVDDLPHAFKPFFLRGPQLPSTEEIEALFEDRKLNTIVFFLDETFEELSYDVTASVLESVEQLAGIIKLQVGWGGDSYVTTWNMSTVATGKWG